jgi:hypothetical protein
MNSLIGKKAKHTIPEGQKLSYDDLI